MQSQHVKMLLGVTHQSHLPAAALTSFPRSNHPPDTRVPHDDTTYRYHDKLANYFDQKLVMLEQEKREIQANLNRNLVEFRNEYQVRAWMRFEVLTCYGYPDDRPNLAFSLAPSREDRANLALRSILPPRCWCDVQTNIKHPARALLHTFFFFFLPPY